MIELPVCKKCGSKAFLKTVTTNAKSEFYILGCRKCGYGMTDSVYKTKEEAIDHWIAIS